VDPVTGGAETLAALNEAKTVHGIMSLVILGLLFALYFSFKIIFLLLRELKQTGADRLTEQNKATDRLVKATEKQVDQNERLVLAVEALADYREKTHDS
jgi:hypothetical protein